MLVDVQSCFKNKADRGLRRLDVQRLRCDLKDFLPAGVPGLEKEQPWVALGKHLCGAATDFALRCCTASAVGRRSGEPPAATQQEQQQGQQQERQQERVQGERAAALGQADDDARTGEHGLRGAAIATCCHHRCAWQHYVGREVWAGLGLSPQDFEMASWMSGWALCGHELPQGAAPDGEGEALVAEAEGGAPPSAAAQAALSDAQQQEQDGGPWRPHRAIPRAERIRVGALCKALIDAGRLAWLQQQGVRAELVYYCAPEVSGENRLLLLGAGV